MKLQLLSDLHLDQNTDWYPTYSKTADKILKTIKPPTIKILTQLRVGIKTIYKTQVKSLSQIPTNIKNFGIIKFKRVKSFFKDNKDILFDKTAWISYIGLFLFGVFLYYNPLLIPITVFGLVILLGLLYLNDFSTNQIENVIKQDKAYKAFFLEPNIKRLARRNAVLNAPTDMSWIINENKINSIDENKSIQVVENRLNQRLVKSYSKVVYDLELKLKEAQETINQFVNPKHKKK